MLGFKRSLTEKEVPCSPATSSNDSGTGGISRHPLFPNPHELTENHDPSHPRAAALDGKVNRTPYWAYVPLGAQQAHRCG